MTVEFLLSILIWFGGNATIAAIVALVVDVLKRFGIVQDGTAGKWSAGLNLLGMVAFSVYFFTNPSIQFAEVDAALKTVLLIVQVVLGYAMQLGVSAEVHYRGQYSDLPLLGYSLTEAKYKAAGGQA